MKNIFLILGYGVPGDILKDENYNFYLKMAFNAIFDLTVKNNNKPMIIFSGGKTDCFKPYKRTEAEEMIRLFKILSSRLFLKKTTKNWQLLPEKQALSSLENLLYSKERMFQNNIKKGKLYIFCEKTRGERVGILAKKIFKNFQIKIMPIDFDVSPNRYLDCRFIAKKEKEDLKRALPAIGNPEKLKEHHDFFVRKLDFIRKASSKNQTEAVKRWWEKELGNSEDVVLS